jgi:hypothetical protein
MDTITAFFAGLSLGLGLWAWVIICIEIILLITCTKKDAGLWAIASLFAFAIGLAFVSEGVNLFKIIAANPWRYAMFTAIYFGIGVIWSFFKWRRLSFETKSGFDEKLKSFIKSLISDFEQDEVRSGHYAIRELLQKPNTDLKAMKEAWLKDLRANRIPDALIPAWQEYYGHQGMPSVNSHKDTILSWIILWPFSIMGYFLSDIISDLCDGFFRITRSFYHGITKSAYRDVDQRLFKNPAD